MLTALGYGDDPRFPSSRPSGERMRGSSPYPSVDMLTALGYGDDPRMRSPLGRLEGKRNRDGTWNLDALHPDTEDPNYQIRGPFYPFGLEVPGRPSRWIT